LKKKTDTKTKTGGYDENTVFDKILENLQNLHFLTNKKWHFGGKILWSSLIITGTQFCMVK